MNERGVLVVGESLVDIVRSPSGPSREYAGGSAANVAVALSRLDRPVWLATSFADDRRGRMLADHLADARVGLACHPGVVDRTSTALAEIDSSGSAQYTFDIDWRLGQVPPGDAHLLTHACSLGAVLDPGAE